MFKKIAIALVVVLAALLVYACLQPSSFRVERSVTIQAPPERVFALINDFHQWDLWSPWVRLDPAMKTTYSGAAAGPGAVYEWQGNSKVGKGRMMITAVSPASDVTIRLSFLKPIESHSTTDFNLAPANQGTVVKWSMYGPNTYLGKVMSIFVTMDKMIGGDLDRGLTNLKAAAEKS